MWRRLGLRLEGELASKLEGTFEALFSVSGDRHTLFSRLRKRGLSQILSSADGEILSIAPGGSPKYLSDSVLGDMKRSGRVQIISGYFLPSKQILQALAKTAQRGAVVRIVLAGKSDVVISQMASRHFYGRLLKAGVEIYEYEPQILHSKLFIFDDVVYVGSANLDRRSLRINLELAVRIPGSPLVRQARSLFEGVLSHCRRIDVQNWCESRT